MVVLYAKTLKDERIEYYPIEDYLEFKISEVKDNQILKIPFPEKQGTKRTCKNLKYFVTKTLTNYYISHHPYLEHIWIDGICWKFVTVNPETYCRYCNIPIEIKNRRDGAILKAKTKKDYLNCVRIINNLILIQETLAIVKPNLPIEAVKKILINEIAGKTTINNSNLHKLSKYRNEKHNPIEGMRILVAAECL